MMADTQTWYQDANHALGCCGNVHIQVWRGLHTLQNYSVEAPPHLYRLVAKYPKGILGVLVVEPGAATPDANGRRNAMTVWKQFDRHLLGMALVVSGDKLRTTFVRAVVHALAVVTPSGGRAMKIFTNEFDAVSWLHTLGPDQFSLFSGFLEELRRG